MTSKQLLKSQMRIRGWDTPNGQAIEMIVSGPAARIPSLKNSKLPGKNFLPPSTRRRIEALDILFEQSALEIGDKLKRYGETPVFCRVLLGAGNQADEDNAFATIKDWLEPSCKMNRGKRRGWGVGLVADDKQVFGYAIYKSRFGDTSRDTTIAICPLADAISDIEKLSSFNYATRSA